MNIYEEARENSELSSTEKILFHLLKKYSVKGRIRVNISRLSREAGRSGNFYQNALFGLEKLGYVKRIASDRFGATLTVIK